MEDNKNYCTSVFKNGTVKREEYTAIWIDLINNLVKNQRVLASWEKRT